MNNVKTNKGDMDNIHSLVSSLIITKLKSKKVEAGDIKVAMQFLKDNNITVDIIEDEKGVFNMSNLMNSFNDLKIENNEIDNDISKILNDNNN